jgi:hypothetical protein
LEDDWRQRAVLAEEAMSMPNRDTFLVALLLVSVACGGCQAAAEDGGGRQQAEPSAERAEREAARQQALRLVESLGGWLHHPVSRDPTRPEVGSQVDLRGTEVTDDQLGVLAGIDELWTLRLDNTGITDEGLRIIAERLPKIDTLYLSGTKITGKGLRHLKSLQNLEWLGIDDTAVRESDLAVLAGMKRLRKVTPFYDGTAKAWLTEGELVSTPWVAGADGALALRVLASKKAVAAEAPLVLLAELRNETKETLHVLRPVYRHASAAIMVRMEGPTGPIKYSGRSPSGVIGSSCLAVVSPGEVVRDRLELWTSDFVGSDRPGKYVVYFTYRSDGSWREVAKRLGFDKLWVGGSITAGPLELTKVAAEE